MVYGEAHQDPGIAVEGPKQGGTALVVGVAAGVALVHLLTNGRYGLHRDELQFLSDARHLDWGFVAYPPMTPFLERIALSLFGLSLAGLRSISVLAQAAALVVTGLMTRELGGGWLAQMAAVVAIALAPLVRQPNHRKQPNPRPKPPATQIPSSQRRILCCWWGRARTGSCWCCRLPGADR